MGMKEKICVVCNESFRTEDGQLKAHQVRMEIQKWREKLFQKEMTIFLVFIKSCSFSQKTHLENPGLKFSTDTQEVSAIRRTSYLSFSLHRQKFGAENFTPKNA